MVTQKQIEEFFAQPPLAVVGVSRSGQKFGYLVYKSLRDRGVPVFAVNPNAQKIGEDPCYPNLSALPEVPGGIVLVVPPAVSEQVVQQAAEAGIKRVWMQPGAESAQAIFTCERSGMLVISGECIMMHAVPDKFPHNFHRWFNKITGKLPPAT